MMPKHAQIRWSDNSRDYNRGCVNCLSETCSMPVHDEYYKDQYLSTVSRQWDIDNPVVGSMAYDVNCNCHFKGKRK
jgi:hypothetical protein